MDFSGYTNTTESELFTLNMFVVGRSYLLLGYEFKSKHIDLFSDNQFEERFHDNENTTFKDLTVSAWDDEVLKYLIYVLDEQNSMSHCKNEDMYMSKLQMSEM